MHGCGDMYVHLCMWIWGGGGGMHQKGCDFRGCLDKRLEEIAKAVGGRLLSVTNAIEAARETVAGHALGALEGVGGPSPPSNASLGAGHRPFTRTKLYEAAVGPSTATGVTLCAKVRLFTDM